MTNICTPDTPVTAEENSRSRQKERNVIRYDESGTESRIEMPLTISFLFIPVFIWISRVTFSPSPSKKTHTPIVIEATTPVGVDEKLGETSFIRVSRFNSRRAVRDIRESSLIVFNRDTVCTWGERIHEGREACMHVPRRREYLSGRAGRSSGWRATVRVSDQLTICRRTRGWFEPPVIRQKI